MFLDRVLKQMTFLQGFIIYHEVPQFIIESYLWKVTTLIQNTRSILRLMLVFDYLQKESSSFKNGTTKSSFSEFDIDEGMLLHSHNEELYGCSEFRSSGE